jgi:hypothetical protein
VTIHELMPLRKMLTLSENGLNVLILLCQAFAATPANLLRLPDMGVVCEELHDTMPSGLFTKFCNELIQECY